MRRLFSACRRGRLFNFFTLENIGRTVRVINNSFQEFRPIVCKLDSTEQCPNQEAGATAGFGIAPLMTSHSMNASSPSSAGKAMLETMSSYCGNSKPVKLMAR